MDGSFYAYELAGWPCEAVQRGELLTVADGVRDRYGAARNTRYESFLGVPLRDESGRIAGHLAVYAHTPREYGVPVTEIRSVEDLATLPAHFAEQRRAHRARACGDCHSTQFHGKFAMPA